MSPTHTLAKLGLALAAALALAPMSVAQAPAGPTPANAPRPTFHLDPDPRVQQKTYHFKDTNQDLSYVLNVSSKVSKSKPAPLIVALHGLGGDGNFIVRDRLVDLAEEGGYIVVGPLGYNVGGWYGSPVMVFGGRPIDPPSLAELSEKDVMNVLALIRKEYKVDRKRTYLMGHSMGGAGTLFLGGKHASDWAALAAIAPAAFLMEEKRADILAPIKKAGIPLMIVQGDADQQVPVKNTRLWADTMKEMGLEQEYIELPGKDHGTVIGAGMPDIFRFFAAHPKQR
jgi:poly(3-hydroxybutyrate) depolymerase